MCIRDRFTVKDDPRLAGGLNRENRGCTDILCLFVFLAFLGAMGFATFYGFTHGDVERLLSPIAGSSGSNGEYVICGETSATKGYDKLYFYNMLPTTINGLFKDTICVK